jgi:hypothetical protein
MKKGIIYLILITLSLTFLIQLSSCNNATNVIQDIVYNKVTAKDRLDSAKAQATRRYGSDSKLVLVLGQNVLYSGADKGRTDISIISAISDPNSLGAWIYIFKKPGTDTLAVFTPDPTPGSRNCIELTKYFSTSTLIGLIPDTSARNIVNGAISLVNNTNFNITTANTDLVDSDVSLDYANSSNPVIKFNASFIPSASILNGNKFLTDTTGQTVTVNMFLIPGLGTLNLPSFITTLTGFPADLWVVNYKKTQGLASDNLILGTVVQSNQTMGIPYLTIISRAINLSKYVNN